MLSPKTTTSPARRAPEERTPLRHIIHHDEADGTIHYLCGIRRAPDAAVKGTHPDKMVLLQPPTVLTTKAVARNGLSIHRRLNSKCTKRCLNRGPRSSLGKTFPGKICPTMT